jgi:hypothetical protein
LIDVLHVALDVLAHRRHLDGAGRRADAESLRGSNRVSRLRGSDQRFTRDAAGPCAVAADPIALGEQHAGTELRCEPCGNQSAGASTDDDEVVLRSRHYVCASSAGERSGVNRESSTTASAANAIVT